MPNAKKLTIFGFKFSVTIFVLKRNILIWLFLLSHSIVVVSLPILSFRKYSMEWNEWIKLMKKFNALFVSI